MPDLAVVEGICGPCYDRREERRKMTKMIRCTEAQEAWDFEVDRTCDFVARAETEDEVLAEITDHMQSVHNWNELYEQDLEKARELKIHDE
jgi:predicted small metal-binding protein